MSRAGSKQRGFLGEVAVDGDSLNSGTVGDLIDLGCRRAELNGRFDDASPGLGHLLAALLQSVFAFGRHTFSIHHVLRNLTAFGRMRQIGYQNARGGFIHEGKA